ncbi:MAG TPA: MlaD family protein [Solirubrobacteraceae bacterium]|nr:MlaD family protein [Solirubrobacteraceae bacterium]
MRLLFSDASGLVSGDPVMIGPGQVGSVQSVSLTRNGQAAVLIKVGSAATPLHAGTVARIEANGLAGIASHYITLSPAPDSAPALASGATLASSDTHAEVSLDELFDTFDPLTRHALSHVIRGEATAIAGRSAQAHATLAYLDPALAATASVTHELSVNEAAFDALLVSGASTLQTLASRAGQLTQLVSSTAAATGAIASRSGALAAALSRLPGTLGATQRTLATVITTLATLTPVVRIATPAVVQLAPFSAALSQLAGVARPTVNALSGLVSAAGALFARTPALDRVARRAFPDGVAAFNASQTQLDGLRAYIPDITAALVNLGQTAATYDANGHYARTQPFFNAFSLGPAGALIPRLPSARLDGLTKVTSRCPGSAVQPTPDGSAPEAVPGCDPTQVP